MMLFCAPRIDGLRAPASFSRGGTQVSHLKIWHGISTFAEGSPIYDGRRHRAADH